MISYKLAHYWNQPTERLLTALDSSPQGLSGEEAARRLAQVGPNALKPQRDLTAWRTLASQFSSPLVLILIVAALISAVVQEWVDAAVVIVVVISSALLSFGQEFAASNAVAKPPGVTIKANGPARWSTTDDPCRRSSPRRCCAALGWQPDPGGRGVAGSQ